MAEERRNIKYYNNLKAIVNDTFVNILNNCKGILLFAYNGTGKTRLSVEFKDYYKRQGTPNTLYFNAFTEDLFSWDNDLDNDENRVLKINSSSKFFEGFKELSLEDKIFSYLKLFADFQFKINYDLWTISFRKDILNPNYNPHNPNNSEPEVITAENIKISRGEEHIFIFCVFLAICDLVKEQNEAYKWVKNIYIDDPISSLDDNNAIALAYAIVSIIKGTADVKFLISTHHILFFNIMYNELNDYKFKSFFLHREKKIQGKYKLQSTSDTPFFSHIANISELKQISVSGDIKTYHFNMLRNIMEKTAAFFGQKEFSFCIKDMPDERKYARALNLLSHGNYSVFEPIEMVEDNKLFFKEVFDFFVDKYKFFLPEILTD